MALLALLAMTAGMIVVISGAACVATRHARRKSAERAGHPEGSDFRFFTFHRPERWLAVRSSSMEAVREALALGNTAPCPLRDGFARAQDSLLFIAPPVDGWIVVVGGALPDPAEDIDRLHRFLTRLGQELGAVQFFSANPVLQHHAWARIEAGRIVRAYAWTSEVAWNEGMRTAAEQQLGLVSYAYGEKPESGDFQALEALALTTEGVRQLAARWSVDPLALNAGWCDAMGIAGELGLRG